MSYIENIKMTSTLIVIIFIWFTVYNFSFIHNQTIKLNIENFQAYLDDDANLSVEQDVIKLYFEYANFDYIPDYNVSKEYDEKSFITYYVRDDSISQEQLIFSFDSDKKLLAISKNWKCHKWRGHQYWDIKSCY